MSYVNLLKLIAAFTIPDQSAVQADMAKVEHIIEHFQARLQAFIEEDASLAAVGLFEFQRIIDQLLHHIVFANLVGMGEETTTADCILTWNTLWIDELNCRSLDYASFDHLVQAIFNLYREKKFQSQ